MEAFNLILAPAAFDMIYLPVPFDPASPLVGEWGCFCLFILYSL